MEVISHRGYWTTFGERNALSAFSRSFSAGFGAEVDVRDLDGELVVSHDPPRRGGLGLSEMLRAHGACGNPGTLAINVKSDGLASSIGDALATTPRWFAFDMSVPDMLQYSRLGLPFYTRQSDLETIPALYPEATGVWLDCFNADWWNERVVTRHLEAAKAVCLVSPELHGRDPGPAWNLWSEYRLRTHPSLQVCTDQPAQAYEALG